MKYINLILFSLLISLGQLTAQDSAPKPLLKWDNTFLDLGKVMKGEKRSFSFTFTNQGNEDVVIDLISACECTTTNQDDLRGKKFKPGESGTLEVTFDSMKKKESDTIDIDIFLQNTDLKTGGPVIEMLQYKYELEAKY